MIKEKKITKDKSRISLVKDLKKLFLFKNKLNKMSEILKIECPKCGKKFDAGSAFNAHIKSTKKQQEEIQKQLLEFQKRQKEQQEVLKELMHDDL